MTPKIRIFRFDELVSETDGIQGETLLQHISAAGIFLDAQCGGTGNAGNVVYV